MKKLILIFLLFSTVLHSQIDSIALQKVRFELGTPFDLGFNMGEATRSGPLPEHADVLMNNFQKYGYSIQVVTPQLIFYNKFIVQVSYTVDNLKCDGKKINSQFVSNADYFIQPEPRYGNTNALPEDNYSIDHFRFGMGWNFKWSKSKYFQLYGFYAKGKGRFPSATFSFKDNASNSFFLNTYSFTSMHSSGFGGGVSLRKYLDAKSGIKPARMYAYTGVKLEFAHMDVTGKGEILRTDGFTQATSTTVFDVAKKYSYFKVGVFLGLGWKKYKHSEYFNE